MCIHLEPAYRDLPLPHPLPRSEAARDHGLILPLYATMTGDEQAQVVAALAAAVDRARPRALRRAYAGR
jgi:dTDP-4-amino-4,6-dideoxygalactose transaminase